MATPLEKEIVVTETIGLSRVEEYVRVGVPFAKGELLDSGALSVLSPSGERAPVQTAPLNRWADGSLKWVLVDFPATVGAGGRETYRLVAGLAEQSPPPARLQIRSGEEWWEISTGKCVFRIDPRQFRPFLRVEGIDGEPLLSEGTCTLVPRDGEGGCASVDSLLVESEGPLRGVVALTGSFGCGEGEARFAARIHFFAGSSRVQLDLTIHNPRAAEHRGGLWDLGDPASLFFRELALEFQLAAPAAPETRLVLEPGGRPILSRKGEGTLSVYQESSGGEKWLSPAHRSADGTVPFTLRGYRARLGAKEVARGMRATPEIWCGGGGRGVACLIPRFWEEFPKALDGGEGRLKVALFPAPFPVLHELQGGEQKTHTLQLDFAAPPGGLAWARAPLCVAPAAAAVEGAGVVPDLFAPGRDLLAERFLGGAESFIGKREGVDEYGWRHFGELPADHEGVSHQGEEPFPSHYNNQYDPLSGMYRAFLATGRPLWGELARDLARHVLDIDLYHTELDREEYNHGLFWHTDHYLPAGLSTHRSFSREQVGERDPRFCGGGPGAEHCYTTGLMQHHLLTGDPEARGAVLDLARWCHIALTGSPTLLGVLKRGARHLSLLRSRPAGTPATFPRYPLSRGTGNAVNACLDAFELSGEREFLGWAEDMIRGALHPLDRIEDRDLLDAEAAWSYTVLLAAVTKYLLALEELGERGAGYAHAVGALLAYARWMCRHEYPYLDKPEILEYPNETWPAQDLRKSVILYRAARYASAEERPLFLERARFFYRTAEEELSRHETSSFTRPVALMLQNGWVGARLEEPAADAPEGGAEGEYGPPTPYLGWQAVAARTAGDMARALRATSLKREIDWLRARL